MKRWIGRTLLGIGLLHTVFAIVVFSPIWAALVREGLLNTVNQQPLREAAYWFLFFGFVVLLLGALIDWCEAQGSRLPVFLGWGLLAMTIVGVVVMPVSGMWLALIPAIGLIRQQAAPALKELA
ncbi:DUF6463 family protein [Hymenobacter cellulosilyticus]|uniref:DUF6463 family protein n=1 Tax=Hymenobacter cellulosilyticus TaxID=2932248 RepID=A0A8T9Q2P5_9BACT|nr:DUF6463 family protein [Hymenobacter cellulosilyticus]UOQ71804.1 DUF6463 family protein [Hymenobacter cellulosilyticus]